jgi:hypothetical protein
MWGVFKTDDPYIVHVAPIQDGTEDELASGHRLDMSCSDIIRVEESEYGVKIVIHEQIN